MSIFVLKDLKSELTFGKISAKILVTVLVGAGWYVIQNLYEYIPGIYKNISQTLYDKLIVDAAHGPQDHGADLAAFFLYIFTSFLAIGTFAMIRMISIVLVDMSKDSSVDSEESTKEVVNNESYIKRFKIFRSLFKIFFVLSIIIFVLAQFAGSKVIAQAEIIREFNRKIDIISPYVDRKIKDRLVSDFSLMKGEKDYLNINKKFDSIFKQNNLTP